MEFLKAILLLIGVFIFGWAILKLDKLPDNLKKRVEKKEKEKAEKIKRKKEWILNKTKEIQQNNNVSIIEALEEAKIEYEIYNSNIKQIKKNQQDKNELKDEKELILEALKAAKIEYETNIK